MPIPNFLIPGVQKSGTSYLCSILSKHSSIYLSNPKEPLFFQRTDLTSERFKKYSKNYFSNVKNELWIGEGSTVYFQWPNALKNIRKYLGSKIKIIICLRHPTDHAISFYFHNYRKGRFNGNERIGEIDADIRLSPVLTSMYSTHIERWLEIYKNDIIFLLFDDLLESAEKFVRQATDFLNVRPIVKHDPKAVNKGFKLVYRNGKLTLEGTINENVNKATPAFSNTELEDLHANFLDDINKTEKLIGRSLPNWKKMPDFQAKQKKW